MSSWVYRKADGILLLGSVSVADPALINTDPANYGLVDLGDGASVPNPRTQRVVDATTLRVATAQEMSDYDAMILAAKSLTTSRQKDILATLACSVRGRNIAAWNAMTTPQKVAATLAEADVWSTIRTFIDDKV